MSLTASVRNLLILRNFETRMETAGSRNQTKLLRLSVVFSLHLPQRVPRCHRWWPTSDGLCPSLPLQIKTWLAPCLCPVLLHPGADPCGHWKELRIPIKWGSVAPAQRTIIYPPQCWGQFLPFYACSHCCDAWLAFPFWCSFTSSILQPSSRFIPSVCSAARRVLPPCDPHGLHHAGVSPAHHQI